MNKKLFGFLAVPALVLAGVGVANAQSSDEGDADAEVECDRPHRHAGDRLEGQGRPDGARRGGGPHRLAHIAEILDIEAAELREALIGGATVADVAAEQGMSTDELVAILVDQIEERIADSPRASEFDAEAAADRITERITSVVDPDERRGHGRPGHGRRGPR